MTMMLTAMLRMTRLIRDQPMTKRLVGTITISVWVRHCPNRSKIENSLKSSRAFVPLVAKGREIPRTATRSTELKFTKQS